MNSNLEKGKRFGEGQPTNKGGAPKGKRISTIIKELLNDDISKFKPELEGMDGNTALATELITMAFHKDNSTKDKLSAIKEILDRIEGKSMQNIDMTTGGDNINKPFDYNKLKDETLEDIARNSKLSDIKKEEE